MARKAAKEDKISKIGQDIIDALQETLAFVEGKATGGRTTLMVDGQAIDIRSIREQLGMTREQFALAFRFNTRTVQN
jgi:DNA-binding transcriptional regulator YiaG